ncbi:11010_t:CDS:2 [Paraglomus brasilianum]|uniref:11010_t:CDS:1 n=1 Tax=Paraglomus brasilianum TaxID=144538 RepID=A0A9N9FG67_9GLOM|nr:11010_t:CDS:2 [Paraglomus brasilianum]
MATWSSIVYGVRVPKKKPATCNIRWCRNAEEGWLLALQKITEKRALRVVLQKNSQVPLICKSEEPVHSDEWDEMIQDFRRNVQLIDLKEEHERPLYEFMDRIAEMLNKNPPDLITTIEGCAVENNKKINAIRRLVQAYKDRFEGLIGLRSGGLPPSPKSKKWSDKFDLSVTLRDALLTEGIENNGIALDLFRKLYVLGAHTYDYNYNVYALDWKVRDVWWLGLLKKVKLPSSIDELPVIEKFITTLLRVENTLDNIQSIRKQY